MIRTSDHRL